MIKEYKPNFIDRIFKKGFTPQLMVYCDYCGFEVWKSNYRFPHWGAHYGEIDGKQLCIPCYEISKSCASE